MSKEQFIYKKDITSKLVDGGMEHNFLFVKSASVLLFALSASSLSQSIDRNFCPRNISQPVVEWKFNSEKKISIATESARLQKRLASIVSLCADDEDIMPIGEAAIKNMKCLLVDIKDNLLKGWNLFPNYNGTLSMELKEHKGKSAIISIGYEMISYSINKGEQVHIVGKEPFSFGAVECILSKMV